MADAFALPRGIGALRLRLMPAPPRTHPAAPHPSAPAAHHDPRQPVRRPQRYRTTQNAQHPSARIRQVVMSPRRVINAVSTTTTNPPLEPTQLRNQLRIVQQLHPSRIDQRQQLPVQIRLRPLRRLIAHPVLPELLLRPRAPIPIALDRRHHHTPSTSRQIPPPRRQAKTAAAAPACSPKPLRRPHGARSPWSWHLVDHRSDRKNPGTSHQEAAPAPAPQAQHKPPPPPDQRSSQDHSETSPTTRCPQPKRPAPAPRQPPPAPICRVHHPRRRLPYQHRTSLRPIPPMRRPQRTPPHVRRARRQQHLPGTVANAGRIASMTSRIRTGDSPPTAKTPARPAAPPRSCNPAPSEIRRVNLDRHPPLELKAQIVPVHPRPR